MKFFIIINCTPESVTENQAYDFCQSLLKSHHLCQLFFYGESVALGLLHNSQYSPRWVDLLSRYGVDATLCINSVTEHSENNVAQAAAGFSIAGMAQLAAATATADRTITFANRTA